MFCVSVLSTEFLQLHRFSNNFDISMETRQVNHFQAYVILEPCTRCIQESAAFVFFFCHICCSRDTNVILWLIAEWFFGVQKYPDGQMTVL